LKENDELLHRDRDRDRDGDTERGGAKRISQRKDLRAKGKESRTRGVEERTRKGKEVGTQKRWHGGMDT
jgi:hypothetical protein